MALYCASTMPYFAVVMNIGGHGPYNVFADHSTRLGEQVFSLCRHQEGHRCVVSNLVICGFFERSICGT